MDNDLDQAKGRVKKAVGDLTGNRTLRREGTKDEAAGKVKEEVDRVGDAIEDSVDRIRDRSTAG